MHADQFRSFAFHRASLAPRMELGGHTAPGVLFHWASLTDAGVHVVDVCESQETADRLVGEKVGPIVSELGLTPPEVQQYDVRNLLSP